MCKWASPTAWAWPRSHCVANWPNWPWLSVFYASCLEIAIGIRDGEEDEGEDEEAADVGSATCGCNCGIMPSGPSEQAAVDFLAFCRLTLVSNGITQPPYLLPTLSYSWHYFFISTNCRRRLCTSTEEEANPSWNLRQFELNVLTEKSCVNFKSFSREFKGINAVLRDSLENWEYLK